MMTEQDPISPDAKTQIEPGSPTAVGSEGPPDPDLRETAVRQLSETPVETPTPMIDIHPSTHAANTWREFFIHIATIVLGLLIAIGLEQTVEYFHERHELRIAREELRVEVEQDSAIGVRNMQSIHDLQAKLNADMALLLAHRATNKPLTGKLDFTSRFTKTHYAALKSNQLSGSLALMPHAELEQYDFFFSVNETIMMQARDWNNSIEIAKAIATRSPDGQLSPQDTSELISAISQTQGQLAFTETLIGFAQASRLKGQPILGP
jgi:hypothetical protein